MRILSLLVALFAFAGISSSALADNVTTYALANCSVTSLTGSSQAVVAANPGRKYMLLYNSGANIAYVNLVGGTAAANGQNSIPLAIGQSITFSGTQISNSAVTVVGTSTQPFTCYEGR